MKKSVATLPAALVAARGLPVRRAFTVIELLVAIGAVAIVTVGLAAIFDAVGKTVQGGKRASALSQYATMVENQLRQDIASIDPNSFMLIRQQFVDTNSNQLLDTNDDFVELYRGQTNGLRQRRIDELMFFARGDFASVRTPIVSDLVARSREARVYYGHGQRMTPVYTGGPAAVDYSSPDVRFVAPSGNPNAAYTKQPSLGRSSADGGDPANSSVNRYASEWTLLRHVTVLQQPNATRDEAPDLRRLGVINTAAAGKIEDKDGQIALQPAAATIFRVPNFFMPRDLEVPNYLWIGENELFPGFSTGTVDVATTDVSEMRSWILGATKSPHEWLEDYSLAAIDARVMRFAPFGRGAAATNAANLTPIDLMHLWMSDAMPTQSLGRAPACLGGGQSFETPFDRDPWDQRIRYETQPVGMRDAVESASVQSTNYASKALQDAYERSAQVMLSAHNFVPRCSEFKVEWSFGRIHPANGTMIWHGPPNGVDADYYPIDVGGQPLEEGKEFMLRFQPNTNTPTVWRDETRVHTFTDRVIYGETPAAIGVPSAVTSYFGYIDPTFDPQHPMAGRPGATAGELVGYSVDNRLMEWPRPKLIRVTMSLADPQNPAIEETFQFVLEVPQLRSK